MSSIIMFLHKYVFYNNVLHKYVFYNNVLHKYVFYNNVLHKYVFYNNVLHKYVFIQTISDKSLPEKKAFTLPARVPSQSNTISLTQEEIMIVE